MKASKKKLIGFISALSVLILTSIYLLNPSKRDSYDKLQENSITQSSEKFKPNPLKSSIVVPKKVKITKSIASTTDEMRLDDFERVPFKNSDQALFLVNGVVASNLEDLPLKRVDTISGIHFYQVLDEQSNIPGSLPVIFNSKTGEYGMISGEVIIRRYYEKAKSFAEQNQIQIVYDDPKSYTLIIRESNILKLQDLLGSPELEKSRPKADIIYYLNQPR
jgi:hypothetical protein